MEERGALLMSTRVRALTPQDSLKICLDNPPTLVRRVLVSNSPPPIPIAVNSHLFIPMADISHPPIPIASHFPISSSFQVAKVCLNGNHVFTKTATQNLHQNFMCLVNPPRRACRCRIQNFGCSRVVAHNQIDPFEVFRCSIWIHMRGMCVCSVFDSRRAGFKHSVGPACAFVL